MGKIIAISQSKGGSCKTTTAVNFTGCLIEKGFNAIVIDIDISKPDALLWSRNSETINFVKTIDIDNMLDEVNDLRNQYDFVIFDTPPNYMEAGLKAIMLSDFVILPASPSYFDQANLKKAIDVVKMAGKPYKVLASKFKTNTSLAQQTYKDLSSKGICFKTVITNRTVVEECAYEGKWIGEYANNSDSHKQFRQLADEFVEIFK
jgi:chromosome partitioning protein